MTGECPVKKDYKLVTIGIIHVFSLRVKLFSPQKGANPLGGRPLSRIRHLVPRAGFAQGHRYKGYRQDHFHCARPANFGRMNKRKPTPAGVGFLCKVIGLFAALDGSSYFSAAVMMAIL